MKRMRKSNLRSVFLLILTLFACLTLFSGCSKEKGPEITADFISSKLEPMSELVSAKLTYHGVIQYKDGNVPFITLKEFLMVYKAEVKAGIDLSEVDIRISDTDVTITIPEEVSVDINVDPDSIVFYAEKTALFNKEEKEDVVAAIQAAEEDVMANGGIEALEKTAREEAALLITGLLGELVGERSLIVRS